MRELLTIVQDSRPGRKSRSFSAVLLGRIQANRLWTGGGTDTDVVRPVWAQIAASHDEAGPFFMNLKLGKQAVVRGGGRHDVCLEWLKSAGYTYVTQRTAAGVLATIYLADLFQADPGMVDPEGVRFVALPTAAWLDAQRAAIDVGACAAHLMRITEPADFKILPERWNLPVSAAELHRQAELLTALAPVATLFALYLDRRTRCPILPDVTFQLQVLMRCLREGLAYLPMRANSYDTDFAQSKHVLCADVSDSLGYGPPVACIASHEQVEQILSEETALFFAARSQGNRRFKAPPRTAEDLDDAESDAA